MQFAHPMQDLTTLCQKVGVGLRVQGSGLRENVGVRSFRNHGESRKTCKKNGYMGYIGLQVYEQKACIGY